MFEEIFFPDLERARVHPANLGLQFAAGAREMIEGDQHGAAADIDIVLEYERDGLRAKRFVDHAVVGPDLFHGRHDASGEREEFLTRAHNAAGDLAAEAAEIVERGIGRAVGAVDPLHR